MARFQIEAHGEKFEIEAPDQASALKAFAEFADMPEVASSPAASASASASPDPLATTKSVSAQPNLSNIPVLGPIAGMFGFDGMPKVEESFNDPQAAYDAALQKVREEQFPDMTDAQWAEYSAKAFKPYGATELSQHGALFGATDEMNAALGAVGSGARKLVTGEGQDFNEAYTTYEPLERARRDLGRQQMGVGGTVAELAGGIASLRPAQAVAGVAPSLLRTTVEGTIGGAALGGAYGVGSADTERGISGLKGALIGGGLSVLGPALARTGSAGYNRTANALQFNRGARELGVEPGTARFLQETLAADDALSPAGLGRVRAAGAEGMAADAGPSARNALDHAVQSSGRAGHVATERISGRVARDSAAIQTALDDALGVPQGVQTTRRNIREGSAADRGVAYDEAYDAVIDYSTPAGQRLEELLQRVDQSAIDEANALMRMEGQAEYNQIEGALDEAGEFIFTREPPNVRQIDAITRALNDRAAANAGLGALGGTTNQGRVYGNLSRDIRDSTRTAVPEYGNALDTAADPIRRSQAVERGSELLGPNTTREMVAEWVDGITAAEREGLLQGIRSNLDDTLANVTRAVADGEMEAREAIKALKALSSRANRVKLSMAIGDEQGADDLFAEIDRATQSFELRASVATNSRTFQRQEMNRRVDTMTEPDGPVAALGRGEPLNAVKRGVQALTGMTKANALQRKDFMMEEAANVLTRRGPGAIDTMNSLGRLNEGAGRVGRRTVTLRQLLEQGTFIGAHQTTRQISDRLQPQAQR